MKWYKKQLKTTPKGSGGKIKLGPSFFTHGNKKMMTMTPPINAFLFGFDQLYNSLQKHVDETSKDAVFSNTFSSTLDSLVSDILNYFQNRIHILVGKKIKIGSVPTAKAQLKKYFKIEIKNLIGVKGYKELKKLDEVRGNFHHDNDRYFIDFRINNLKIESVGELLKYINNIRKIMVELDDRLEKICPAYDVQIIEEEGKTTVTTKAIHHSFDLNNMKINKKNE